MNRTVTAASLLGLVLAGPGSVSRAREAPEGAGNVLVGRIFHPDGTPVTSATVSAYHLGGDRPFSAPTTPESGSYILSGLPDGDYEIWVQLEEGTYYASELVILSGGGRTLASFWLQPGPLPAALADSLRGRGLDLESSVGIARMESVHPGKPFWATGAGVATILLGVAAGGVIVNEALEDDDASPSGP